jgi:methyltransferase (TIGR00027 family)
MAKAWVATTAKWIAASRARETAREDRLFSDPFAASLAGKVGQEILARSEQAGGGENKFLPVRTRYFDDVVLAATDKMRQMVNLGAGFDTRAFRLSLKSDFRIFELDLPEVFAEKEAVLASLGAAPRCHLKYVPTSFDEDWVRCLLAAGFESGAPSLWIAEGLFFYLSQRQVEALLQNSCRIATSRSLFVADFSGAGILERAELQSYLKWLETRGDSPPFCHDDPVELFTSCGWEPSQVLHPGQPEVNYGRFPLLTNRDSTDNAQTHIVKAAYSGASRH